MQPTAKYTFSGHESFACKSLWLKKGYDFIKNGHSFNAPDAVVRLGVGKNMVASIRYWMKAFGMTRNDLLTGAARLLLDSETGYDPYLESLGSLWLLCDCSFLLPPPLTMRPSMPSTMTMTMSWKH